MKTRTKIALIGALAGLALLASSCKTEDISRKDKSAHPCMIICGEETNYCWLGKSGEVLDDQEYKGYKSAQEAWEAIYGKDFMLKLKSKHEDI